MVETAQQAARRLAAAPISEGYEPQALHDYTDSDGNLTHHRIRLKHPKNGSKWVRPMYHDGQRYVLAEPPQFSEVKPLYRLHDLARRPNDAVFFVEGEKCADLLAKLGFVTTTSGSSSSHEKADYSVLAGRKVVIWPDKDGAPYAGQHHAAAVAEKLTTLGCQVELIDIQDIGLEQGDCEDWLKLHPNATAADVEALPRLTPDHLAHSACDWDDPLPLGEIDAPEIPTTLLPGWLGAFSEEVRRSTQTPPAMSVMLALSTVSACVQRRFEVRPYGDGYREPLCIWTVTALPPASRKTAVINELTAPLIEWERTKAKQMAESISRNDAERRVIQKRIDKLQSDAAKVADALEREQIVAEITDLETKMPPEMRAPRLWTADATPERLQGLLVEQGERMSVISDEGVIFAIMAGLYNDGQANIDIFLKAHAGSPVRVDRNSRTAHLNQPALTFGLAIQPQILTELSSGSQKRFRGTGMLARFLYCVPKSNIGTRDVNRHDPISDAVRLEYHRRINDLLEIAPQMVDDEEVPRILSLSADALCYWQAFAAGTETNIGPGKPLETIQDWAGKLPGAALRLAGLMHVSVHGAHADGIPISKETMTRALDLAQLLVEHALAAFGQMDRDQATTDASFLLNWLRSNAERVINGKVRKTDLHDSSRGRFQRIERLMKAIERLQQANILGAGEKLPTRKPTQVYPVNPGALQ